MSNPVAALTLLLHDDGSWEWAANNGSNATLITLVAALSQGHQMFTHLLHSQLAERARLRDKLVVPTVKEVAAQMNAPILLGKAGRS